MKLIIKLVITIFLLQATTIITASAIEDDWDYAGEAALYLNDTYSARGYVVKVTDFDKENNLVLLEIVNEGVLLNSTLLNTTKDEFICEDEVKIVICNSSDDPLSDNPTAWANPCIHLEFYTLKKPSFNLDIDINRIQYRPPDSDIHVTVEIENNGDAKIEDVNLHIDPDGLQLIYGKLTYHFSSLEEDEEKTIDLKLRVPELMNKNIFNISANISGMDTEDEVHTNSDLKTVTVWPVWDLELKKKLKQICPWT